MGLACDYDSMIESNFLWPQDFHLGTFVLEFVATLRESICQVYLDPIAQKRPAQLPLATVLCRYLILLC